MFDDVTRYRKQSVMNSIYQIRADFDADKQTISFQEGLSGYLEKALKEVYDFKEQKTRDALIALGWKPPKLKKTPPNQTRE